MISCQECKRLRELYSEAIEFIQMVIDRPALATIKHLGKNYPSLLNDVQNTLQPLATDVSEKAPNLPDKSPKGTSNEVSPIQPDLLKTSSILELNKITITKRPSFPSNKVHPPASSSIRQSSDGFSPSESGKDKSAGEGVRSKGKYIPPPSEAYLIPFQPPLPGWPNASLPRSSLCSPPLLMDWGGVMVSILHPDNREYAYRRMDTLNNSIIWADWTREQAMVEINASDLVSSSLPPNPTLDTLSGNDVKVLKQALCTLAFLRFNRPTVDYASKYSDLLNRLQPIMVSIFKSLPRKRLKEYCRLYLECMSPDMYEHELWGLDPIKVQDDTSISILESAVWSDSGYILWLGDNWIYRVSVEESGLWEYIDRYYTDEKGQERRKYVYYGNDSQLRQRIQTREQMDCKRVEIICERGDEGSGIAIIGGKERPGRWMMIGQDNMFIC